MPENHVERFHNARYLNLESFRKNGQGIRTPVWFVEMDGKLYFRTPEEFAKVKRIRRNPRVRIVPSDMRGRPKGEWVEATARIVEAGEAERANELLKKKYGWQRALIDLGSSLRHRESVVIALTL